MIEQYEIIKEQIETPKFPIRELLVSKLSGQTYSRPFFGPSTFRGNIAEMQRNYTHPVTRQLIFFGEPSTRNSIDASACGFKALAKPEVFDPSWLQAGYIVRTSEGVFANPPKDKQGNSVIDEKTLKQYLDHSKRIKVGKGYLYIVSDGEGLRDFGFAEYGSFLRGVQSGEDFAVNSDTNGLARVLEHTKGMPQGCKIISGKNFYSEGVNVVYFDSVKEPVVRVVTLYSRGNSDNRQLQVDSDNWDDNFNGYASGVLD